MDSEGAAGFGTTTSFADALDALAALCDPLARTATVPLAEADGRVLAEPVTAARAIPHYDRAASDGWAVRASDTEGASDGSPTRLERATDEVTAGTAVRVDPGEAVPRGADAVLGVEAVDQRMEGLAVYDAVTEGAGVDEAGGEVAGGSLLFEPGHRLVPADLALCQATGVTEVAAVARPRVVVVPTGDASLADGRDPAPGEAVETNSLLVARYCERWGATTTTRADVVPDVDALGAALVRQAEADLLLTTGGLSGGAAAVAKAVRDRGELPVSGVDCEPGGGVGIGRVEDTPLVALPGPSVGCLVATVQCCRRAVGWLLDSPLPPVPTTAARLASRLESDQGVRSFRRVAIVDQGDEAHLPAVAPVPPGSGGVSAFGTGSDGWLVTPEGVGEVPTDATVTVEQWGRSG